MDIKDPICLKKILVHYQNRINNLRSDKNFEIRTEIANGFIEKTLQEIPKLISTLDNNDKVVRINQTSFPDYQKISCMAINQYIRDLKVDWTTLENRLAHDTSYLQQIKKEIETAESLKKNCGCD